MLSECSKTMLSTSLVPAMVASTGAAAVAANAAEMASSHTAAGGCDNDDEQCGETSAVTSSFLHFPALPRSSQANKSDSSDGGSCCCRRRLRFWEHKNYEKHTAVIKRHQHRQRQQCQTTHQDNNNSTSSTASVVSRATKKGHGQQCVCVCAAQQSVTDDCGIMLLAADNIAVGGGPRPTLSTFECATEMPNRDGDHAAPNQQINDNCTLPMAHSQPNDRQPKLRTTQLIVMPIEDTRRRRRLGNGPVVVPSSATVTTTATATAARRTTITITTNISETTTLQCRCFRKNGDIFRKDIDEECAGQQVPIIAPSAGAGAGAEARDLKVPIPLAVQHQEHKHKRQHQQQQQQQQQIWLRSQVLKTFDASKWVLRVMMLLLLTTSVNCWAGRQDSATNCTFPERWEGSWFLSGYQQPIHIKGSEFSYRGKCAASDGNKYLIVDEKGCHRCLVIYEKHNNVLQYKESECEGDSMYMHQLNPSAMAMHSVIKQSDHRGVAHPNLNGHSRLSSSDQLILRSNDDMNDYFCKGRETLQNLCDQIPGDALLYSLFRENAVPVKCPLKGPFIFTYNRGHGECKSPLSNIESCTEESRLLLSFQACPDVQGTESTVEELTCLATWKDGNSRYLVGLVSHHHAISNEERYRCFVYEKINPMMGGPSIITSKDAEYKLAQSGDATCNGLDSAEVGSRIMSLRKPPLTERCDFPVWFKGPRHWHALMGNALYSFHPNDGSVHIIKSSGYMETRALCEQINKQTATEMMAVVHYTTGCQSGFMCMMFYRRDIHVIEIQSGKPAFRLEDACAPDHFDTLKLPYLTLLASNPDPQFCPAEGLYNLRGAIGPPYLATRHKRNHNNKAHNGHGHHRAQSEGVAGGLSNSASAGLTVGLRNALSQKRHATLSFRNADRIEKGTWHANTRGLQGRNRRAAAAAAAAAATTTGRGTAMATPTPTPTTANPFSALGPLTHSISSSASATDKSNITESTSAPSLPLFPPSNAITIGRASTPEPAATETLQTALLLVHDSGSDSGSGGGGGKANESGKPRGRGGRSVLTTTGGVERRSRRNAPGCITNYKAQRRLGVGCTQPNVIDVRPMCPDEGEEEYSCHGSWAENGTVYIIARHKGTKHGVCITYRPTEGTSAKLVIGDACHRGALPPPEHHLVANLSIYGKCGETRNAAQHIAGNGCLATLVMALLLNIVVHITSSRSR